MPERRPRWCGWRPFRCAAACRAGTRRSSHRVCAKPSGHGGQCAQAKLVGIARSQRRFGAGGRESWLALARAERQCACGRHGKRNQLGIGGTAVERDCAVRDIQPGGTCFSFSPDQAIACRLLRRAARGASCVVQSIRQQLLDRRGLSQPAKLLFQVGSLGRGKVGPVEPPAQDAGQVACPFAVAADDP